MRKALFIMVGFVIVLISKDAFAQFSSGFPSDYIEAAASATPSMSENEIKSCIAAMDAGISTVEAQNRKPDEIAQTKFLSDVFIQLLREKTGSFGDYIGIVRYSDFSKEYNQLAKTNLRSAQKYLDDVAINCMSKALIGVEKMPEVLNK